MRKTNNYPFVLVHGYLCWGNDDRINDICPLFGMWNGSAKEALQDAGYIADTPSVGMFSGMWDRACELYAFIKGVVSTTAKSIRHATAISGSARPIPVMSRTGVNWTTKGRSRRSTSSATASAAPPSVPSSTFWRKVPNSSAKAPTPTT